MFYFHCVSYLWDWHCNGLLTCVSRVWLEYTWDVVTVKPSLGHVTGLWLGHPKTWTLCLFVHKMEIYPVFFGDFHLPREWKQSKTTKVLMQYLISGLISLNKCQDTLQCKPVNFFFSNVAVVDASRANDFTMATITPPGSNQVAFGRSLAQLLEVRVNQTRSVQLTGQFVSMIVCLWVNEAKVFSL